MASTFVPFFVSLCLRGQSCLCFAVSSGLSRRCGRRSRQLGLDLLYQVARVLSKRTKEMTHPDYGAHSDAHIYPLSKVIYCAHCERKVQETGDLRLRSALTGAGTVGKRRYRHKDAHKKCGCLNQSVPVEVIDESFAHLIRFIGVKSEAIPVMTEWLMQINQENRPDDLNWQAEIQKEIVLCKRRIQNSRGLCRMGQISLEEFQADLDFNQHEIAR